MSIITKTRATTVLIGLGVSLLAVAPFAHAATLTTDKADYAPGETATIYGSLFDSLQQVVMSLVGKSEDGSVATTATWDVQADAEGSFTTSYTLPDTYVPLYLVAANSTTGQVLAETTFTDASISDALINSLGTPCGTNTSSVSTGTSVCVRTTASVTGGGSLPNYYTEWINPSSSVVYTDNHMSVANGAVSNVSHTLSVAGTWTVRTCKNTPCNGSNTFHSTTINVTSPVSDQTITVDTSAPASAIYNDSFSVVAHASSGLPVAITTSGSCSGSGSNSASIKMTNGTGTCTVHYNQAGNGSYNPAPEVTSNTTATKATAVCTIVGWAGTYDGSAHGATGSCVGVGSDGTLSGLDLGSSFTDFPGGNAHWAFTGGANYNVDSGNVAIDISKATSTTVVTCPASVVYNGSAQTPCTVSVTGAGGLSLTPPPVYANNTNAGTATASYTYSGDQNHTGSSDSKDFTIEKADPKCSVSGYDVTYNAVEHTATGSCTGVLDETLSGLDLSGTTHTNAGDYTDTWAFTDITGNYNNASDTVSDKIAKADPVCAVTGYAVLYDGLAHTATGSCLGVLGETLAGLDLSATTHTAGGAWTDPWAFTDITGNYNNKSGTVNDVIIAPQPPITIAKKDFQNGSTIPVKIPSTISSWTANLYVCAGDSTTACVPLNNAVASGASNVGTLFRYDTTGKQYIYNLSTKLTPVFKGAVAGSKYSLWIKIDPVLGATPFKLATITIK